MVAFIPQNTIRSAHHVHPRMEAQFEGHPMQHPNEGVIQLGRIRFEIRQQKHVPEREITVGYGTIYGDEKQVRYICIDMERQIDNFFSQMGSASINSGNQLVMWIVRATRNILVEETFVLYF